VKILLTGASSFTGTWFALGLAKAGHEVIAPLVSELKEYQGIRRRRLDLLEETSVKILPGIPFGEEPFRLLVKEGVDVLCHHRAVTRNYQSEAFDVPEALRENTRNFPEILQGGRSGGLRAVVMTGSIFEAEEGTGSLPLRSFSPYGLSKGFTYLMAQFWAEKLGVPIYKYVVPNPFGPWEEPRFCDFLIRHWFREETPTVRTPVYVRDNIHVDLLTLGYVDMVERAGRGIPPFRCNPSGYTESQGEFAQRFAREMRHRLGLATPLQFADQVDFSEPEVRINTDRLDFHWSEKEAWDRLAEYYRAKYYSK